MQYGISPCLLHMISFIMEHMFQSSRRYTLDVPLNFYVHVRFTYVTHRHFPSTLPHVYNEFFEIYINIFKHMSFNLGSLHYVIYVCTSLFHRSTSTILFLSLAHSHTEQLNNNFSSKAIPGLQEVQPRHAPPKF